MLNNAVFAKTIENVRKDRDIKLAPTERRRNYSVSGPNYHTTKFFTGNLLAIERKILMNKLVYLGLSILKFSKILMYELWYDYVKPKYLKKTKMCYMNTDSFIGYVKADILQKMLKTRFDTSNYELE